MPIADARSGVKRIAFRISILASGSSGNSTLLETEHTALLVDAGLGKKEMLRRFEALGRAETRTRGRHSDLARAQRSFERARADVRASGNASRISPSQPIAKFSACSKIKGSRPTIERVEYIRPGE